LAENNHIIADLLARIRGGSDCSAGNPAVIRNDASTLMKMKLLYLQILDYVLLEKLTM